MHQNSSKKQKIEYHRYENMRITKCERLIARLNIKQRMCKPRMQCEVYVREICKRSTEG